MTEGAEYLDVGHLVQFYEHDGELTDQVAGYLLGALGTGGSAVVIATPAHRRAIETRLAGAHADLAAAARDGRYLTLDAGETLATLMPDGQLDPGRFERVVGAAISRAVQARRPVRAYGEMVALLWDAGLVGTAIQLEERWNELRAQRPFSLLCSYPAASAAGGHLEEFAAVCRLHRAVTGPWPGSAPAVTRGFAFSRNAPRAARHFAVDAVARLGAEQLAEDVALVVTELAANAIVHARTGFTVGLSGGREALRISVCDGIPAAGGTGASLGAEPLHGLYAVAALASRWGVEPLGQAGKAVWAELRRLADYTRCQVT
jgi:hypothetical protein